jgi:hypothetical protein
MHQQGQIDADKLQELKETIKEKIPEWLEAVGECDDPGSDPLERWWL